MLTFAVKLAELSVLFVPVPAIIFVLPFAKFMPNLMISNFSSSERVTFNVPIKAKKNK